jgi:hypothetical protein
LKRDPKRFVQLIVELNELLAAKEGRITSLPEQRSLENERVFKSSASQRCIQRIFAHG